MPIAKRHYDRLSPALLYYLVYGDLPPRDDRGSRTGLVEAFQLKHAQSAAARAEVLRTLWVAHADEIRAATPRGTDPWVLNALRSPDEADDGADGQKERRRAGLARRRTD